MTKVAIIYYSATGTTYELAKAVEAGAKEAGAETKLLKVKETAPEAAINSNEGWKKNIEATKDIGEATTDDLEWADAIIFGTPTRYGGATSQLRAFIDTTGGLWAKGALIDKIGSSIYNCGNGARRTRKHGFVAQFGLLSLGNDYRFARL